MALNPNFAKSTAHSIIVGLTFTALANAAVAAPVRLPAITAGDGHTTSPYLVPTQQQGGSGGTGGGSGGSGGRGGSAGVNDDDTTGSGYSSGGSAGGPKPRIYYYINTNATDRISDELSDALAACSPDRLERQYRIDCLRLHFWRLSRELPATGEYAPVRAALAKAATDLDAIVRRNLDTSAPRLRVRAKGKPAAPLLPPIRAVRPGTEARAAQQAERVIAEATTALLRSTENSDRRMAHYQQIAAAISSTKVLLRSA